jgi:serine/threonine protein kinase
MVGSNIGPYRVIRKMAEDRFGEVFEAIDPTRRKRVLIKSLRREAASRPEVLSRLYSEAQTLALLNHPHGARLYGFIRANDNLYLVMEFIEGESLRSILREKGRLEPHLALAVFHQILSAVKFAHELGVVHGDLKPSNIMVANFAQIKVLDFAIAPILGDLDIDPQISSAPYTAPEQIKGQPVDDRSDIYSLGVLLYELLVGKLPFSSDSSGADRGPMPPPSKLIAKCPPWLDAFLLRALAASPTDRFQSVAAMAQAMGPAFAARRRKNFLQSARDGIRQSVQRLAAGPAFLIAGAKQGGKRLAQATAQTQASFIRSFQTAVAAHNPWKWTKRGALRIESWMRGIRPRLRGVIRSSDRSALNERFSGFAQNNLKRYAVLATLLVSVLIETFVFRGANTLLSPELNSIPVLNRTGGVQSILEPLNSASAPAPAIEVASEPEPPKPLKRSNQFARVRSEGNELHHDALDSRRTVTYRSEPEKASRPVLPEPRLPETKRNPETKIAKVQLNIRWEN